MREELFIGIIYLVLIQIPRRKKEEDDFYFTCIYTFFYFFTVPSPRRVGGVRGGGPGE